MPEILCRLLAAVLLGALLPVVVARPAAAAGCPAAGATATRTAPGNGRTVALTFDDGPGPYTPQVLDVLRAKGVRATFFMIGNNAQQWPEYARQVAAEGHQVGNHTMSHPHMAELSRRAQGAELDRGTAAVRAVTGVRPCVFRPPFGSFTATTVDVARDRRMTTAMWTVSTNDWAQPKTPSTKGRNRIVSNARKALAYRHPVLLLHDGGHQRPNLIAALPTIIDDFRARGYRFVDMAGRSGLREPARVVAWRHSPTGRLDAIRVAGNRVTVTGWAFDRDAPTTPLTVELRLDDAVRGRQVATLTRTDVTARYPAAGPAHGFRITVPLRAGTRAVCVTAVNRGPGARAGLGCTGV